MCELPEAYVHDRPRARKTHRCCECGGVIAVGEVYHSHHGIWPDGPERFKVCSDCEELRLLCDKGIKDARECTPFGLLLDSVCVAKGTLARFVEIKRKRHAKVENWMLAKLVNEK